MTDAGKRQVTASARVLVGAGKLIEPTKLARVFISPRLRAQQTFDLMFPDSSTIEESSLRRIIDRETRAEAEVTEDLAEWDYGDYEGLITKEIRALREEKGLDGKKWDHFRDGCEGGE